MHVGHKVGAICLWNQRIIEQITGERFGCTPSRRLKDQYTVWWVSRQSQTSYGNGRLKFYETPQKRFPAHIIQEAHQAWDGVLYPGMVNSLEKDTNTFIRQRARNNRRKRGFEKSAEGSRQRSTGTGTPSLLQIGSKYSGRKENERYVM